MTSPLELLPVEMWDMVFDNFAPMELLKLQEICRDWRDIIENLVSEFRKWHKYCTNNIPDDCRSDILSKKFPSLVRKYTSISELWTHCPSLNIAEEVGRAWNDLAVCLDEDSEFKINTFPVDPDYCRPFSITASYDYYLGVFNTNSGTLNVYDIRTQPITSIIRIHDERYSHFKFWTTDDNRLFVILLANDHDFVTICDIPGGSIESYDVPLYEHALVVNDLCFFIYSTCMFTPAKLRPDQIEVSKIEFETESTYEIYSDAIDVRISGSRVKFIIDDHDRSSGVPIINIWQYKIPSDFTRRITLRGGYSSGPLQAPVRSWIVHDFTVDSINGDRVLFRANDGILIFNIQDESWQVKCCIDLAPDMWISKSALHSNLLILGTSTGWIYIYGLVDETEEFFDFFKPSKRIHLGNHEICGIEIMYNNNAKITIVVFMKTIGIYYLISFEPIHQRTKMKIFERLNK